MQGRPKFDMYDTTHSIGCKCAILGAKLMINVIQNWNNPVGKKQEKKGSLYQKKDFSEQTLIKIKENMDNGMIKNYVINQKEVDIYDNSLP